MSGFCYHTTVNKYRKRNDWRILIVDDYDAREAVIARAFLQAFHSGLQVYSAGLFPADATDRQVKPLMHLVNLPIEEKQPQAAKEIINNAFDFVLSIGRKAKAFCERNERPGRKQIHFDEVTEAELSLSDEEFIALRDSIKAAVAHFCETYCQP